jgi:hypothetical protein
MRIQYLVSLLAPFIVGLTACANPTLVTTTPTAAPPTTASSVPDFPKYGHVDVGGPEVAAGLYRTPAFFSIPFTFETLTPFKGIGVKEPTGEVFGLAQGTVYKELLFWAIDPKFSIDEAISQLRATPNAEISPNQAVQVAGISATQFDLQLDLANSSGTDGALTIPAINVFMGRAGGEWYVGERGHARCIVLDVNGRAMLIYIEAPQEEWDYFIADAEQVLGTVKFTP